MSRWPHLAALLVILATAAADTPVDCHFEDVVGKWTLYEGPTTAKKDCSQYPSATWKRKLSVTLSDPNKVVDQYGNEGTWTMIYNQGFQVNINGRSYYGWSSYQQEGKTVTSFCHKTDPGLAHDMNVRDWTCFWGEKNGAQVVKKREDPFHEHGLLLGARANATHLTRGQHQRIVDLVNSQTRSWRAAVHEPFVGLTVAESLRVRGGRRSWAGKRPRPAPVTPEQRRLVEQLPKAFDWRKVDGADYVSPVRNQLQCGSCYAFSSAGMLESRVRMRTKNAQQPVLSPQDVVSCTNYAQGCDGGFPFLIAGRYGKDFGMAEESCIPYVGVDMSCPRHSCHRRLYSSSYSYVGGYYGACNEALMMLALVQGGPLAVSFEATDDFKHYKSGIYHQVDVSSVTGPTPHFEEVNHAVLLVGYGEDEETQEKYWIVRNSWGSDWGEDGYFRIRRGTDELAIESIAVEAEPIPWPW